MAIVRAFVRWLRSRFGKNIDIRVAQTVEAARELVTRERFTALFVDVGLPDGCGIDAIEMARALDPGVPAFVITALAMQPGWVLRLAALGVARYDKPIVDGLVLVLAERAIATRAEQQNKLFAAIDSLGLTDAESDVVLALARGETVAVIAAATGREEHTIENQLASVRTKLRVHSQAQIVSRVVDAILALG